MNTIINSVGKSGGGDVRKRGHCITLYIISLIAITLGVGLCIGVPCYLHSTFHVNRQYNKIVQRVNKEISDTHINEDMMQLLTCTLEQEEGCFNYMSRSFNVVINAMMQVSTYTFNFQGMYLMSQYQTSKQQLQFFIKWLLNLQNIDFDEFVNDYPVWSILMDLEKRQQNICKCRQSSDSSTRIPCNKLDGVGHAVDMLFEEGHYCALDSDNNTIFSDKTIEMMEKFVKL